jgi:beta-galactosidase GanA
MYICYCDRSRSAFHHWLEHKHGAVGAANKLWHTSYKSFDEVVPPPVKNSRPLPGTNRALWYDWARFNQDRFTDYLVTVRDTIRKLDRTVPLAAGGSSSMLAGRTGTTGIDEERIVNEVDDVIIHEGGGSTMGMDLQLALSETRKPLADPEMSIGAVEHLLPHFLHGKSVAQIYHWPSQPANEFYSNNRSSLAHSWSFPLADVNEVLRVALDVRRLNREIAAFVETPAEVAILYSQTSTLQLPPEMLTWQTTPYLEELRNAYEAGQYLDAKTTFVTERQIGNGRLAHYKLLIVPGVRNLPASVVQKIWDYAAAGGRVLVLPESLLADEYNNPQPYLSKIGVEILKTERPKPGGGGRMLQGYDQAFSEEVTFTDNSPVKLAPSPGFPELSAVGVRQVLRTGSQAEVLSRYPDRGAAVVRAAVGRGKVYYSGASLRDLGYAKLLDNLFDEAGVSRPVRVRRLDGHEKGHVEARLAMFQGKTLLYIANFESAPARLEIEAQRPVTGLKELRENRSIQGRELTVPARQTCIYELL